MQVGRAVRFEIGIKAIDPSGRNVVQTERKEE